MFDQCMHIENAIFKETLKPSQYLYLSTTNRALFIQVPETTRFHYDLENVIQTPL